MDNIIPFSSSLLPSIFNALSKFELVSKNRVKNCLSCNNNLVLNDDKYRLKKYLNEYTDKGFHINYKFLEGKDFGRINQIPFTGLGTFSKPVRGYLAKDVYIDVDAVNCYPVILRNEFIKKGIDTCIIDEYVNDSEEFLRKENITKEDFLKMINKEDFVDNNTTLTKLHNQIYNLLLPSLLKENANINEFIKKSRSYNKHGAFIANYLQSIEFNILIAVSICSEKEGVFIDVFMHDGFFVRITKTVTEEYVNKEMIPKYEKVVLEQFGINMKYKVKPHDLSLIIPDNIGKTQLEIHTETLMMYCKKEQLKKSGDLVYKKKNNHPMYYEDYYYSYNINNKEKPKTLNSLLNEIFIGNKTFNSQTKHKDELIKYITQNDNLEDFPEMTRNSNYIAFKNGCLQLEPLMFYSLEEITESAELNKHNARNYVDEDYTGSDKTPTLDKLINAQLSDEAYDILRVLIGRLFFDLNIHDKWQVAMYIQGIVHTGKSTLLEFIEKCMGACNVGTLNKNDKVFQLSAVYQKDLVIIPDIKDHKNYIDEDVVQTIVSGELLTIRAMRTTGFTHKWNKPIIFASNFPPDWSDPEGALKRRLVFFYFGNSVDNKDAKLPEDLEKEMPNIIHRCITDYFDLIKKHPNESDFSKLIPQDLQLLKDEFKKFSDPLSEYLSLGKTKVGDYYYSISYKKDNITPVEDFKKRFGNWLSNTKHTQSYRVNVKSKEFTDCGFVLVSKTVCKSCGNLHIKTCCEHYNSVNRTSKQFFEGMYLMKEDKYGKPVKFNDDNTNDDNPNLITTSYYKTIGIPTIGPKKIQFRSKIEAHWAYLFENFKWKWEYEPYELNGYIPDFIINMNGVQVLIEIKGANDIWKEYKPHLKKIRESGWKGCSIILGSTYKTSESHEGGISVGIFSNTIDKDICEKSGDIIIRNSDLDWDFGGEHYDLDFSVNCWKQLDSEGFRKFEKMWSAAKNLTQWKGEQNLNNKKDNKI